MPDSQDGSTLFTRAEKGGGVRRLNDPACGQPVFVRTWERVGALRTTLPPQELPEGHLLNDLVVLNLGAPAIVEANVEHTGWELRRIPNRAIAVIPAAVEHELRLRSPIDHLFVEVAPELCADALGPEASLRPCFGAQDDFAEHVLLALAAEARAETRNGAARVEKLAAALLSHLAEAELPAEPGLPPAAALPSTKLRRVLEYVSGNLDSPLALAQLAELAGMDVFRFGRAFKQSTGTSPHRYVLEARVARAKELLADRALPITEIALATGFATPSHFSVAFRRLAGMTPRDWRDGKR